MPLADGLIGQLTITCPFKNVTAPTGIILIFDLQALIAFSALHKIAGLLPCTLKPFKKQHNPLQVEPVNTKQAAGCRRYYFHPDERTGSRTPGH